ncbi:MAG: radical SAM protein [Candidatus Gastranaerophilales bacterium]|nr:radical SAM protein [Candidatus Gastranaerophilales bacterium]
MSLQLLFKAPYIEMESLENIWFQLSNTACNLKCKHCFLSCNPKFTNKSFLHIDKVKQTLDATRGENIKNIYLTGGEPLLHPEINNILRLCLRRCNTTILTNGTMLNDKKVRFLRQLEDNYNFEIIFRVSLDHYDEIINDRIRTRGHFRKAISGIQNLIKYEFNPIISTVNYDNRDDDELKSGFRELFDSIGFETEDLNYKIIPPIKTGEYALNYGKYQDDEFVDCNSLKNADTDNFDCKTSRIITQDGVYSCPALATDSRGKIGTTIQDYSKKVFLEANTCYTCKKLNGKLFNNDW